MTERLLQQDISGNPWDTYKDAILIALRHAVANEDHEGEDEVVGYAVELGLYPREIEVLGEIARMLEEKQDG